jgi:hypothetical protein
LPELHLLCLRNHSEREDKVKAEETATVSARVSTGVHETLTLHAQRCGRSIGREVRLWSEFGAAATVYAQLHEPRIESTEEIEQLRMQALADMTKSLIVLLPHTASVASAIESVVPPAA